MLFVYIPERPQYKSMGRKLSMADYYALQAASFKKVFQKLEVLHEEVGGLREEVIRLREAHAAAPAASPPPPVLPKLPMETEEDVAAMEAFLAEESNFEYMVSHLKSFDGPTLAKKANGMMSSLFTLELAVTYTYKRSTGKRVFEGTAAEKAVRRAAMESFRGLASKEYTFHLGNRFRNARGNMKKQEDAYVKKQVRAFGGAGPEVVQDQA
ncbi:uncharacterized protein LOC115310522 [Ixodes scapularis]|uniref:uncharacterized protein LOC115310522 n=1 Tax=Ixodes scapularis TaxID=6945 RepID=UPI001A9EE6DB|nr:uncharacterized protein LOC115310522 [Ixodes scapularis]